MRTPVLAVAALALAFSASAQNNQDHKLGYDDTPSYAGSKWKVHDSKRPRPAMVSATCNAPTVKPPSDAEALFNGTDTSKWVTPGPGGAPGPVSWKVENGYMEVVPGKGGLKTKEAYGDIQLHVEWAAPATVAGDSQNRGNSGIMIMGQYEIQVLDSWDNPTYADGQATAIYGQYPPYVNASCKPGEWQAYDIVFEAPKFEGDKLVKPAYATVFHNGVLTQNHEQVLGPTLHRQVGVYKAHGDAPLELQNHNTPVRYRSVWVRRLKGRIE
ncbi:MAG: hypothetical protein JWN34_3617 [Bryobacterales bacterium]|nr:hypothetical protein [Bryobacterales bacterium]